MLFDSQVITIFIPLWIVYSISFIFSFAVTFYGIPAIVRIARMKNLYDLPGDCTSHSEPTPRLGGTIIFSGVILSSVLFSSLASSHELKYIIAGMIILFFIGFKDDVVSLVPYKKAIGQFMASLIIVVTGDIHLTCCNGLFHSAILDITGNVIISLFIVMALINSINFTDGIDGLASGIGIIASLSFGIWFIFNGQSSYGVFCFALLGSLIAFFYYNVFSKKNKIFLGDTGSMLIGFLLAVFLIRFLELNSIIDPSENILKVAPSLSLAILFVPIFDSIRISIIRIYNRKSIFVGDNNHIHHKILRLFGTHLRATMTILSVNILIIVLTYVFRSLGNTILIICLFLLGIAFSSILGMSIITKLDK